MPPTKDVYKRQVLAIVVATAVRAPEYRVNFMFIGTVRLKYVALFMVVTDLLFMTCLLYTSRCV